MTDTQDQKRLTITLQTVVCGDTEDLTGADEFYVAGGVTNASGKYKATLTKPIDINDGQTKTFSANFSNPRDAIIFDDDVAADDIINVGLEFRDADVSTADFDAEYQALLHELTKDIGTAVGSSVASSAGAGGTAGTDTGGTGGTGGTGTSTTGTGSGTGTAGKTTNGAGTAAAETTTAILNAVASAVLKVVATMDRDDVLGTVQKTIAVASLPDGRSGPFQWEFSDQKPHIEEDASNPGKAATSEKPKLRGTGYSNWSYKVTYVIDVANAR
ncbi:hypothetical protein [Streptomyces wuyuanensis]|uniref:hypothetical protein n=1 Tax=Streptomyces wuyuanensis TaxID=1196353 RepID=UPI00368DBDB1